MVFFETILGQYFIFTIDLYHHKTAQHSTVQYSTVQYNTIQYSTVQYSTVQYSTVQYSTAQHSKQRIACHESFNTNQHTLLCVHLLT